MLFRSARFLPEGMDRSDMLRALAGEIVDWIAPLAAALLVGEWVARLFNPRGSQAYGPDHVGVGHLILGQAPATTTPASSARWGLVALAITVAAALAVIRLTSGGLLTTIRQGQTFFSIGAAFFAGALVAHQITRARHALWPMLAIPIVAAIGYLLGAARPVPAVPEVYQSIIQIMPNAACRALPVEYMAMGPIGVLLGLWTSERMNEASRLDRKSVV